MSNLNRYNDVLRKFDPRLGDWAKDLHSYLDRIVFQIGGLPETLVDNPQQSLNRGTPPPAASFNVTGIDGKFVTIINNPQTVQAQSALQAQVRFRGGINLRRGAIVHNLQSATDLNFNQNSNLKDYGTGPQLIWTDQDPNVIRFFRLRSSFDGENWNAWQVFSSALTCGPVGVQSGLLRTAALTPVNGAYTPTTQPLTSATGGGVNQATISIASFPVQFPPPIGTKTYNSGSITPLNDSTTYFVYCLDPTYAGGTQTYIASTSNPDVTGNDAIIYLGKITTPAHGGGGTSGSGGGGGPCFLGSTGVITKDGIKLISNIRPGDEVLTQRGWRKVRRLIVHEYSGPMHKMDCGEHVTPSHRIWHEREWQPASEIFRYSFEFHGHVFNLEIDGDGSDEEQCYALANGWIAHNVLKL